MNPVMLGLIIGGAAIVILAMTFAANNAFHPHRERGKLRRDRFNARPSRDR